MIVAPRRSLRVDLTECILARTLYILPVHGQAFAKRTERAHLAAEVRVGTPSLT